MAHSALRLMSKLLIGTHGIFNLAVVTIDKVRGNKNMCNKGHKKEEETVHVCWTQYFLR